MKVFITGATGVLGRRVLPALIAKGHSVAALSRSEQNAEWLTRHGAEPRTGDLFDEEHMAAATADCHAILHLATAIPTKSRTSLKDWEANDRIRREGTRALLGACVRNKCRLFLQQSVTFLYGDHNGEWVSESAEISDDQPAVLWSALDMERLVQQAMAEQGVPAVILRFGSFYCHDSKQTAGMLNAIARGRFPIVGDGSMYWNMIAVDDAASAVVASVKDSPRGIGGVFNICDDAPVTMKELVEFLAETLDAKKPGRVPAFLARLALGSHVFEILTASVRCRNDRAKQTLGWMPRHHDYRSGFTAEIGLWRAQT